MIASMLPEKARMGLTWRRLRNAFRAPSLLLRNARFWWNEDVSQRRHIFVVGPPRSGTTLLKNVLQSHSEIYGVKGETRFFLRKNYADFRHPSLSDEEMKQLVREARSPVDLFDRFAKKIWKQNRGNRFLEKTPEHALRLPYLISHFPRAHIVFIIRDPRDGLRSARAHPLIWSTFPDEDRLGGYLTVWRQSVKAYLRHADDELILKVRYEDLCREPQERLETLMGSIGLGMENQQLDPGTYGKTETSKSDTHDRLRKPITPKSVGKWRDKLTERDVRRVERTLAKEMQTFGYSLEYETDG